MPVDHRRAVRAVLDTNSQFYLSLILAASSARSAWTRWPGQHRSGRLLQDLVLCQLGVLKGKVCILNAASGSRQVGRDVGQVVHRVAQAFGNGPELRALDVHRCYRRVDLSRCRPGGVS